ncbi:MAG: PKD domain-containing protein [Humibacillus sp.]|nr:PKD domain-containing protein [Humibacillus sp.]
MFSTTMSRRLGGVIASVLGLFALTQAPAQGSTPQDRVPVAVPSTATPDVNDGTVFAIEKTGSRVFLGGDFTSVTPRDGGASMPRNNILAFDAATGAVDTGFVPQLDGEVDAIAAGPDNTVYVAGLFKTVNGKKMRLARLDAATGEIVSGWKPAVFSALTTSLALSKGVLYVGGYFAKVGGVEHSGLTALDPQTGKVLDWFNVNTFGHHGQGSAKGGVGARKIDIDATGTKMVVIGNFTSVVDGGGTFDRDQVFRIDLGSGTATVDPTWRTLAYTGQCYNWAFDSYIRDVQISPDGSYFVIVATGGGAGGQNVDGTKASCDAASRYEMSGTGTNVRPTWINYAGGDSLWSVVVTGTAVYAGGHQRWSNNYNGNDFAGAGAVPRAGLVAMDPQNGLPLSWNPGRNPRGAGAFALLATDDGLYVGSDTSYIGNFQYNRGRIAYFPLAGGSVLPANTLGTLPGKVFMAGGPANARPDVLYRVNAGGGTIGAPDGGPDWSSDDAAGSPLRNSGSNAAGYSPAVPLDGTVPSGTPSSLFDSERWDPGSKNDGGEMKWSFPVQSGTTVDVRVYLANRCDCTAAVGQRKFDVSVQGATELDDFDIVAAAGKNVGTMRHWSVVSNGTVTIDFGHEVENPLVNAIEIVQTDPAPPAATDGNILTGRSLNAAGDVGASSTIDSSIAWSQVRGAFMVNGMLYYGLADGTFNTRSFDGTTLGPVTAVDPYNDPFWSDKQTGSGQTYRGVVPGLYGSTMSSVTSMFYSGGKIYYTLSGQADMRSRAFTPESGIMGPTENKVDDGNDWRGTAGAFVTGSSLYYATKSDGVLHKIAWGANGATGSSSVVDSSQSWATRGLFLMSAAERVNEKPVAALTSSCATNALTCSFDAGDSADPDGSITGYAWDFGDGQTETTSDSTRSHTYASSGAKTVTVTVTDNDGATSTASVTANVSAAAKPISFRGQTSFAGSGTQSQVGVPAAVAPGDTLLLFSTISIASATSNDPAGWTLLKTQKQASGMVTKIWSKVAAPSDPGSTITVTYSAKGKIGTVLAAYAGGALTSPVSAIATSVDSGTATHVTPVADVSSKGSWAVSYWSDRSSPAAKAWVAASDTTARATTIGSGTNSISTLVGDSGEAVTGASYGPKSSTADGNGLKGVTATVIIKPAQD